MTNYSGRWTAGLSAEKKARLEEYLSGSEIVLDRLVEICYNMIRDAESTSNDYDSPNWALRQADLVGRRKALMDLIKLCTKPTERTKLSG